MATIDDETLNRRKLALIIVNRNYVRANRGTNYPDRYTTELKNQLQTLRFNVTTIQNEKECSIMRSKSFLEFQRSIQPGDLVFLYYIGFACQDENINYFLPLGSDTDEKDINFKDNENNVEHILDRLKRDDKPWAMIVVLDCCMPFELKSAAIQDRTVTATGLGPMNEQANVLIQFTCSANETTEDDLFFKLLLRNLDRENVHVTKLFHDITEDVCRKRHGQKKPFFANGLSNTKPIYLNPIRHTTRRPETREKHALLIANNLNTKAQDNLRRSLAHARLLEAELQKMNFTVVKHANVFNEERILKNVKDFSRSYANGDIVFVYFSCLAHQVNGINYLIPSNDESINTVQDVEAFGADFGQIIDRLTESQRDTAFIFVFNCCRASTIQAGGLHSINLPADRKIFIQYPCAVDDTTKDDLFMIHLLRDIDRKNIDISEIFDEISEDVFNKRHQQSRPHSVNQLSARDIIFLNQVDIPIRPWNQIKKSALIIKNEQYKIRDNCLRSSIRNAKTIKQTFDEIKFETKVHKNLVREDDFMRNIKEFANDIFNNDIVVFYYFGHAQQFNGKNYLIPTWDNQIHDEIDIETNGVNVDRLLDRLTENAPAASYVFIFDCCRLFNIDSGAIVTQLTDGLNRLTMPMGRNVFIQYSCPVNKITDDNLFTRFLLQNIDKKNVPIAEVFRDIVDETFNERNHRLKPYSASSLPPDEPVFLNQQISILPNVQFHAQWKSRAKTPAGDPEYGSAKDRLKTPQGISLYKNRTILIADSGNHRLMKCSLRTKETRKLFGKGILGVELDMLANPSHVIFCKQIKSFIICDYHNRRVLSWSGKRSAKPKILIGNIGCFAAALDDKHCLYISVPDQHEVLRFRMGETAGKIVAGGNGQGSRRKQLNHPTYICVDDDQTLYISDSHNDRVVRWKKGDEKGTVVAGGKGKGRNLEQLDCPAGVVVDQLGTLYVADRWNHRIMRYRENEEPDMIAGDRFLPGSDASQLICPEGLLFDRKNNLYVADSNNHRIQQFQIKIQR